MHGAEHTDARGPRECRQGENMGDLRHRLTGRALAVSELWVFLGVMQPFGKGHVDCFTCPVPARALVQGPYPYKRAQRDHSHHRRT